MRTLIPVSVLGHQSLVNFERGDIVYLRACGGISQAKVEAIHTTFRFDYYTAFASGEIYAKFLLPDGSHIVIDSTDRENWYKTPHFYLSYEDCRLNRNQLGYTLHDHPAAGRYLINLICEKYGGLEYHLGEFNFHAPTKSGVMTFPAKKVLYYHDNTPFVFDIWNGKYVGTVDELREEYCIHTTHESALEHHRPKLVKFEDDTEKPKFRKVRVTKVCEVSVPADEVENYIANINPEEIESDDWETSAEVIK